jgi:hypothetical protein
MIAAGKLLALAVTGATRSKNFPELPPIADTYPGYEVSIWIGLFAPAGTPDPVLQRLRAEMKIALASPELQARLNKAGGPGGHEHPDREVPGHDPQRLRQVRQGGAQPASIHLDLRVANQLGPFPQLAFHHP